MTVTVNGKTIESDSVTIVTKRGISLEIDEDNILAKDPDNEESPNGVWLDIVAISE